MNTPHESMAMDIFFNGGKIEEILNKHGMKLKPKADNNKFIAAFTRGIDKGRGKFEREMMHAGIELEKVCEKK